MINGQGFIKPHPSPDAQSDVPNEAVSDGLNPPPNDNSVPSNHDPAQDQAAEPLSAGESKAESPQVPPPESDSPAGSAGSGRTGFYNTRLVRPSFADENDDMGAAFDEPAPELTDMIQEIERGDRINGKIYYLFFLRGGEKILLCGDQLADGKLLHRILAARGFLLGAEHKRELRELIQQVSLDNKFVVVDRAGWYENVYIAVIRSHEYFIETKIYGKNVLPIYLKPCGA